MPKRIITDRVFDLRDWQQEAFRATINKFEGGKADFLCVATPGAGKTKYALRVAHYLMNNKLCDRVVIVTPTDSLKRQWSFAAAEYAGLDIDPDFTNAMGLEASDYHGVVITYSALGKDKKGIHAQNTFSCKTFVIFDEIHHLGDSLSWGEAATKGFGDAVFRLAISGTAFRSDDNEIPFITYENRMSKADYIYSYDRAIKENVCRPVYFSIYDGQMKWKVGTEEFEHNFKESLTPDQVSKRLKTALDPEGNWVRDVLRAADQKLNEIRKHHTDAAAMVFAATQQHAKQIADVVMEITGELPPIIISEDAKSTKQLEDFKINNSKWLVSVKMVSEGVDIPRLRLGVYFTIIKAELFFRQAVGRFVRVLRGLHYQDAFIFIPKDKDIVKLAESIQEERDHALDEAEKSGANGNGYGYTDLFGNETFTPALQGKFTPLGSEATDNQVIEVTVAISNGARHSVEKKNKMLEDPVFLQKHRLRESLNKLAKRVAINHRNGNANIKPDWRIAHKLWIDNGGREMNLETIDELDTRLDFYKNLLRSN